MALGLGLLEDRAGDPPPIFGSGAHLRLLTEAMVEADVVRAAGRVGEEVRLRSTRGRHT